MFKFSSVMLTLSPSSSLPSCSRKWTWLFSNVIDQRALWFSGIGAPLTNCTDHGHLHHLVRVLDKNGEGGDLGMALEKNEEVGLVLLLQVLGNAAWTRSHQD